MNTKVAIVFVFWTLLIRVKCDLSNLSEKVLKKVVIDGVTFNEFVDKIMELNISTECYNQLKMLNETEDLLYKMADAWSKPYSGMNFSSKLELGNFDECINIDYTGSEGRVLGRYCAMGLIIPTSFNLSDLTSLVQDSYKLATCIPDKCTSEDLSQILPEPILNQYACSTKEDNTELDTGAIVTLAIIATVVAFMLFQTAYDVYFHLNEQKVKSPYLVAFSVFTNGKKLFHTSKGNSEQILCFNGLKFITMMWIIAGHGAAFWEIVPTTYGKAYAEWYYSHSSNYLRMALYGVDTFFYIAGFLMAYQYFKTEVKKPVTVQTAKVPILIIYRYLRLTPALLMCFLFVTYLARFIGSGPGFNVGQASFIKPCKENWWSFFLYIQNYYNPTNLCITATWYLSADMQLFLFAIPVTILLAMVYKRRYTVFMGILFVMNLIFIVLPIFTKLKLTRDLDPDFSSEYDSHSRLNVYFIGFMFGAYVRHNKQHLKKINNKLNLFIWCVVLIGMYVTAYVTYGFTYEYEVKAIAISLGRPIWCLQLCWIVYSCLVGQGGIINWFLSCGFMQLGGKLVYCLYLMHGPIISYTAMETRTTLHFTDYILFYNFCGHLIVTTFVAIFWTLAFESPVIILEKALLRGSGRKPAAKKTEYPIAEKKGNEKVV